MNIVNIRPLISAEVLRNRVRSLAGEILEHYSSQEVEDIVVMPVLDGALVFASDLIRQLRMRMQVQPVRAKSYVGQQSSGSVSLDDHRSEVSGKHVLIVEDICDSGLTLTSLIKRMKERKAASVMTVVLLDKVKAGGSQWEFEGWIGFKIEDKFVVGYGLDLEGYHRNLPYIGEVLPEV